MQASIGAYFRLEKRYRIMYLWIESNAWKRPGNPTIRSRFSRHTRNANTSSSCRRRPSSSRHSTASVSMTSHGTKRLFNEFIGALITYTQRNSNRAIIINNGLNRMLSHAMEVPSDICQACFRVMQLCGQSKFYIRCWCSALSGLLRITISVVVWYMMYTVAHFVSYILLSTSFNSLNIYIFTLSIGLSRNDS